MIFELISKIHSEAIDRVDLSDIGIQGAKTYFMGRKQLSEEQFDEMFEVKKKQKYQKPKNYDWWKEESTNLDIEKG
tara:strand:- start:809 stop:1036 length:228 start_codon:yes stop_codon:yes gene_type:complete